MKKTKHTAEISEPSAAAASLLPLALVVDDDESFTEIVKLILQKDFRVITACDGLEALKLFRQDAPDIVVTDIVMPRLDGFMLVAEIRKTSDTPIVVISGAPSEVSARIVSDFKANAFIAKPYIYKQLKPEALRQLAAHREAIPVQPQGYTA